MNNLVLAEPGKEYKKSFEDYISAYEKSKDTYYFDKYKKGLQDFNGYLEELYKLSKGIEIPEDWVRTSTFWLINNGEIAGVVRVRHEEIGTAGHIGYDISPLYRNKGYGTEILKLALVEAEKIGIKEVIVTCNINNIASRKIIEKSNGKLLGTIFDEEDNEYLYKYSITV